MALKGANLDLGRTMQLPAHCRLHMTMEADSLYYITKPVAPLVTSVSMDEVFSKLSPDMAAESMLAFKSRLSYLRRLRLVLGEQHFTQQDAKAGQGYHTVQLAISMGMMPRLEVAEIDLPCAVEVRIVALRWLRKLVVRARGSLSVTFDEGYKLPEFLQKMFLLSGVSLAKAAKAEVNEAWGKKVLLEEGRYAYGWRASLPRKGFWTPRDLRDCCCGACMDCLSRKGVPILCQ